MPVGRRPIFRFSRDGRFADEGVFATFLKSLDGKGDEAGAGTYEIKDFTITLRYSDGRVKRLALTGLLGGDPAARNEILYFERSRFNKMK